ncbi:hypothetical protein SCHPADRAFT_947776 [Schizopora paradoxa]|uniref:DUF6532 domain-containing protein n=1 Tax=Schizopora paradoxa TaxID=27342 RepID=A0A0H2QY71_9AGAM|nr:hypothetical protein SCHPADRAFT_947776 [Schizopora paradoxa]
MAQKGARSEDEESGSSGSEFEDRQTTSKSTKKTKQSDQRKDRFYEEVSRTSGRNTRKSTKQLALDDEESSREQRKREKEMKRMEKELQKEREDLAARERELQRQRKKAPGGTSSVPAQAQDHDIIEEDDLGMPDGEFEAEYTEVVTVIQAPPRLPLRRANEPSSSVSGSAASNRRRTDESLTPASNVSSRRSDEQSTPVSDDPSRPSSTGPPRAVSNVPVGRSSSSDNDASRPFLTPQPSTILDEDEIALSRESDIDEEVQRSNAERKDRRKEAKEKERARTRKEGRNNGEETRRQKRKSRDESDTESDPDSNSPSDDGSSAKDRSSSRSRQRKKRQGNEKSKPTQEKAAISRLKSKRMVALVNIALRLAKALIISGTPFPSSTELDQLTVDSWSFALKKLDYDIRINAEATKIIYQRPSQLRGNLITVTRPLTQAHWALGNIGDESRSSIASRVAMLREGGRFLYQDISTRKYLFKNTLIQQVIKNAFFADKKSIGIQFSKYFNPIAKETLALVLTAIDHVLNEHTSGVLIRKDFSEHEAYGRYLGFLKIINGFQAAAPEALRSVLQDLHDLCRDACGAGPVATTSNIISTAELALAARCYEEH